MNVNYFKSQKKDMNLIMELEDINIKMVVEANFF